MGKVKTLKTKTADSIPKYIKVDGVLTADRHHWKEGASLFTKRRYGDACNDSCRAARQTG